MSEHRVTRDGVEIAYWVYGEGPPLVLLIGLGVAASAWGPLPMVLSQGGYKVVAIDNRDAGMSSSAPGPYGIPDMAVDVVAVLDDAGIKRTDLLGLSMGGEIAQQFAIDNPDRVNRLMLVSTLPGGDGRVVAKPDYLERLFAAKDTAASIAIQTAPGFAEEHPGLIESLAERWQEENTDPSRFARQWDAIVNFDDWDSLSSITCPTLILHGGLDEFVPLGNAHNLASRIPDSKVVVIEGVGHLIGLERPFEFVEAITSFFLLDKEN
ncbi:MAG: alpha/beta hydrolase [Actinomycetota bacterium]